MSGDRRLAAIMFTDMIGYSALAQANEARALELLETHFDILRPVVAEHDGTEVKTIGDAILAEFASPLQAVRCAIEAQRQLHIHNVSADSDHQIRIRIGIHLGDVEHRDGDVFGDGVNVAARIEPLAPPEGICVTRQVADQVANKLDASLVSQGEQTLKNIQEPVEVLQVQLPWQATPSSERPEPTADAPSIPTAPEEDSIAVLPFADLSPEGDHEYFSDGMAEELIDALAKLGGLKVISRTSAFHFKGKDAPMRQIGEELGVRHVLEGSVRKAGDRVRVTAQLIDVATDQHLWSEKYDRDLEDIFAVQDEIARAIVDELKGELWAPSERALVETATENTEAYQEYLRGRFFMGKRTETGLAKAIEHFRTALELDPDFASAHAELALCHHLLVEYGLARPDQAMPQANRAASRALELDPSLATAHAVDAEIRLLQNWDWDEAERGVRRAIDLNPADALPHYVLAANVLAPQCRFDEAEAAMCRALELDPLALILNRNLGVVLAWSGRFDEAEAQLRRTRELDSRFPFVHLFLGVVHLLTDRPDEAVDAFRTERDQSTGTGVWLAEAGIVGTLAWQDRRDEARAKLTELIDQAAGEPAGPWTLALAHVYIGHHDTAIGWLERAFDQGFPLIRYAKSDLAFRALRSDPRYGELLGRINLAP